MASLSQQCNPRANVFLMVNLGCEMLYVIDQRLKAQQICEEKSTQGINKTKQAIKNDNSFVVGGWEVNERTFIRVHVCVCLCAVKLAI